MDQMPGFESLPLFAQFFLKHPNLFYTIGLVYGLWIAFALGLICIELHAHNSREEKKEFRRQFEDQRQERYASLRSH